MEKKNYKFELKGKKVWVAGHNGMVGKSLVKRLRKENCLIQTVEKTELNLVEQEKTNNWIKEKSPNVVILAAAKVGGIFSNNK